jgi:hypothetical protein
MWNEDKISVDEDLAPWEWDDRLALTQLLKAHWGVDKLIGSRWDRSRYWATGLNNKRLPVTRYNYEAVKANLGTWA